MSQDIVDNAEGTDILCKPYSHEEAEQIILGSHQMNGVPVPGYFMTLDELMGVAMRVCKGQANPQHVREMLKQVRAEVHEKRSQVQANHAPIRVADEAPVEKDLGRQIIVDTQAGYDNGDFMIEMLESHPDAYVLGYCGNLDKYCKLTERFLPLYQYAHRVGFRCADVGLMPDSALPIEYYNGILKPKDVNTLEHPSLLPKGWSIIRLANTKHLHDVMQSIPPNYKFESCLVDPSRE